jgi:two-component system, OmpR family, phosphate regulon sensor histidine kinase PhoR
MAATRNSARRTPGGDHNLQRFADAIQKHRGRLLKEWREQVRRLPAAQKLDVPTLDNHIPALFDELIAALFAGDTESVLDLHLQNSPKIHGSLRLRAGFDIVEVVAEYNILRERLHGLAEAEGIEISGDLTRILNRVIDRAIGLAVESYATERAIEIQQRREEHFSFLMHDLRTPLSAMHTARTILADSLPPEIKTGRVETMLQVLFRNSGRLNALIHAAAQEQTNITAGVLEDRQIERREFDLWAVVEGLIHDLQPLERGPVRFVNTVPHDFVVFADALLITQVFQNLLSNAIKYTSTGHILVGAENNAEGVRCWVSDTGAGIPPERLGKVFDKLETDPERKGGLGLGLAIVKQIVEAHGGQIIVESRLCEGSTFSFTLDSSKPLTREHLLRIPEFERN